ncbi:recombinase XerD [Adhaeribacter arboris]|uniref:Recombinase XerD n=1 Tax=Adhaeribacter arboris TaxID=2072846 RepID=A0A2T2YK69_9BACT|nr:site-specific integrase [Adhaeribacter arboris]PSR55898.1 recombinase XerD [Adhaeribacter arboris]
MSKVTTEIVLNKRIPMKDGTFRVKLRVTYLRKQIYYPTKFTLSESDFERTRSIKPRAEFKDLALSFNKIETKAKEIIDRLPAFTFEAFEKRFSDTSDRTDVFSAFDKQIQKLEEEERVGTRESYESARNSLISFVKRMPPFSTKGLTKDQIAARKKEFEVRPPLPFINVTVEFLKSYEKWMKKHGRSRTTIGIYLRPLRALFNVTIEAGDLSKEFYPFGKRKYKIPSGSNVKKALEEEDIALLFNYHSENENELWARDMWILTYLANGINMKDIAHLKNEDLDKEHITFIRAKTELTTIENQRPIIVTITPLITEIIKRWRSADYSPRAFVFPILNRGMTPKEEHSKVRDTVKKVNKYIRQIAQKQGIEDDVTTYVARHSMATVLNDAGVPTSFISDLLGHGTEKTTKSYIDGIKSGKRAELTIHLTTFLEKEAQTQIIEKEDPLASTLKVLLKQKVAPPKIKLTCIKTLEYAGGEFLKGNVIVFQNNKHLVITDPQNIVFPDSEFTSNYGSFIYLNQIAELLLAGTTGQIKEHFKVELINDVIK